MTIDLGALTIERLIVHEVPRHLVKDQDSSPTLSQIESPVNQEIRNFFREKISGSLARASYEVEFDPSSTSPVPDLVEDFLGGKGAGFVASSQEMANHLHQCQGGPSPEGLLTVVAGKVASKKALAILKLEKEEGARIRQQSSGGKMTFNIDHIRDLMLTGKTKVFKVGLFSSGRGSAIDGIVCDQQRGYGTAVANFFLTQFLGCKLLERPEITTKRFFDATESFINDEVADPERKAQYQVALLAELSSNKTTVSIDAFANNNIQTSERRAFVNSVRDSGIQTSSIKKDTALIDIHLRRIQLSFKSGVSVLASPEHMGKEVKVKGATGEKTRVEIVDELKDLRGRR